LDCWTRILDEGGLVDAVYLDFQKAFDTVPHQRLLLKLSGYGVTGDVLGWIEAFLSGRRQRVIVNGEMSSWAPVTSGIPQGSVLGPILFVCFINDLPDVIHTMVHIFADNTKVYNRVDELSGHEELQDDLRRLQQWSDTWLLRFNAGKCKVMHLGSQNPKLSYVMAEGDDVRTLEITEVEKDLGVYVDSRLKFSDHIEQCVNKSNKLLGLIRRSYEYLDGPTLTQLFTSLIRPHLEYGNVVWSPRYKKDHTLVENVQRRATKLVPGLKDIEYPERLRRLNLPSLLFRRARGDMIEVYKHLHGIYKLSGDLLPRNTDTVTRGHTMKLKKCHSSKGLRHNFFSLRVVDQWNSLPEKVVSAPTMNTFKNRLDRHWSNYRHEINPDQLLGTKTRTRPRHDESSEDEEFERLTGD
jgi:hypothetical protein